MVDILNRWRLMSVIVGGDILCRTIVNNCKIKTKTLRLRVKIQPAALASFFPNICHPPIRIHIVNFVWIRYTHESIKCTILIMYTQFVNLLISDRTPLSAWFSQLSRLSQSLSAILLRWLIFLCYFPSLLFLPVWVSTREKFSTQFMNGILVEAWGCLISESESEFYSWNGYIK